MAGVLTLTQLAQEVCNTVKRDSTSLARDGSTTWLTRAKQFVNWAQDRIVLDASSVHGHNWVDLRTDADLSLSAAGLGKVSQPSDCKAIYSLHLTSPVVARLRYIPMREFFDRYPNPVSGNTGQPIDWTAWQKTVYVNCIPDQTYTANLKYSKWHSVLGDSDATVINGIDNLLVTCAAYLSYQALLEDQAAEHFRKIYEADLQRTVLSDRSRDQVEPLVETEQ